LIERLQALKAAALRDLEAARTEKDVEDARVRYLGRKGEVAAISKGLGALSDDERKALGKALNEFKTTVSARLDEARLRVASGAAAVAGPDLTLPGRRPWVGRKHPITRTLERLEEILLGLGFEVAVGPEVEDDFHNFEALNIPPEHPARDQWDTFYVEGGRLLRTHTSPVQIRVMQSTKPPVRIVAPGRVYRNENPDASHGSEFYQLEGLYVDRNVTLGELKGVMTRFLKDLLGDDVDIRFRPGFFPFTEPSAEVDVRCSICGGKGCSVCKGTGWVELVGSGMVDPRVFRAVGYDPDEVSGYAFGLGVDRICMMLTGTDDIRLFLENDLRFLRRI